MNSIVTLLLFIIQTTQQQEILDDLRDFTEKATYPIKHVIVLMLENRSFDHVFGWMTRGGEYGDERVDGLYGNECNPRLVNHLWAGYDCVNDKARDMCDDPEHGHVETTEQIFGCKSHYKSGNSPHVEGQEDNPCVSHASTSGNPTMSGYSDNSIRNHHINFGQNELTMWASENVPIMTTLAKEFALFDRYFASYPGPTDQNRLFMHSGTARGSANTGDCRDQECYPQKSIYKLLEENGLDWKLYFEDNALDWFLFLKDLNQTYVQEGQDKIIQMENFYTDIKEGKLPAYTFLNPSESVQIKKRHTHSYGLPNDQHPPHSMKEGERLIKNVYEALRNSPRWNDTLLIINYDEHGGFFDHVAPPQNGVPNPDGLMNHYGFNFTRLGVRLPFMLISPWINKGTLVHEPKPHQKPFETSQFEHSSVIATVQKIFGIGDQILTNRTEWAATFDDLLLERSEPRTDCIELLPEVEEPSEELFQMYYTMEVAKHELSKVADYCRLNTPDDPECGTNIKTKAEYGAFIAEHDQLYIEKYRNKRSMKE